MRPLNTVSRSWLIPRMLQLNGQLEPGSVLLIGWGGIPAYFTDFRLVDAWGYNEKKIARMDIPPIATADYRKYNPGHAKKDIDYALSKYQPDFAFFSHGQPDDFWQDRGYEFDNELLGWRKKAMPSGT